MTAKDVQLLDDKLDTLNDTVIEFIATFTEKFNHIPTRNDMEKEITKQIELEQAKCPNRSKSNTTDWIRIIKIVGIITIPIISAITGHEIGVQ